MYDIQHSTSVTNLPSRNKDSLKPHPLKAITINLIPDGSVRLGNLIFQIISTWGIATANNVSFFIEYDNSTLALFQQLPSMLICAQMLPATKNRGRLATLSLRSLILLKTRT